MAFKMFSTGLVLVFAGMCLCQQQQQQQQQLLESSSQYQPAVSQASFQIGSAATQQQSQTKLEDIERDTLVAGFGQKNQQQTVKSSAATPGVSQQQSYQSAALPQQYYVQPFQAQQPQFYVQPYQMAFDYSGVQYMIVPNAYNLNNQVYQQYYTPSAPQPSAVPQYVTKQSSSAAAPSQQEYKQQEYKQQQQLANSAQTQQEYKQQYVASAPAYQYVPQPTSAVASPADYSYITRHPSFKAQTANVAIQPQFQYSAIPQQYPQYQQPQYYYVQPAGQSVAAEQPRIQQSAKSQYSSGVKSTTPFPPKEPFSYKFESSPLTPQQQQSSATYSTIKYSV